MDKIKKMIVILIIMAIIIVILMIIINHQDELKCDIDISIEEVFDEANKIEKIDSKEDYFFIKECLNKYSTYSNDLLIVSQQENDGDINEITSEIEKEYMEQMKEELMTVIPQFVKNEMNVNIDNAYQNVGIESGTIRINSVYTSLQTINEVAYEETTSIYAYVVDGVIIDENSQKDFQVIILIDKISNTFLIIPENYIKLKKMNLEEGQNLLIYEEKEIQNNVYNVFSTNTHSEQDICVDYFNEYKFNLEKDNEFIYEILNSEYKEKRFKNIDGFKEYVQKNINELKQATIIEYLVNYYSDYTEYVCKDQNENLYIFKEKGVRDFELLLDTYTITTEKFKQEYENANEQKKVMMNVDKWIQMLNNRDYTTAFNMLDETFRNNNFNGDENVFEEYMRNRYPLHYKASYGQFEKRLENIYSQQVFFKEIDEKAEAESSKEINIIMKLNENAEFVMSFTM